MKNIVIYPQSEFADRYIVENLETVEELHSLLRELNSIKTMTNQPMTEYSYVFPANAKYPVTYDEFWKSKRDKSRTFYTVAGSFFVQRTLKNGKIKQKFYNQAEDFDWQFDKWEGTDVVILNMNEALNGDYIHQRDIIKYWGDKELLCIIK